VTNEQLGTIAVSNRMWAAMNPHAVYRTPITLDDYGFCMKGEGGAFVEDGKLGPGGSLPTNTGGGELSGYCMWGTTPLSEAIIQARGQGGILGYHSTLILSPQPSLQ
jgi:acetyl-CoA acetyltransferase